MQWVRSARTRGSGLTIVGQLARHAYPPPLHLPAASALQQAHRQLASLPSCAFRPRYGRFVQSSPRDPGLPALVVDRLTRQSVFLTANIPTALWFIPLGAPQGALAADSHRRPRRRPAHARRAPEAGRPASYPALQVPRLVTATDACRSPGAIARCRVQSVFVCLGLDAPIVPSW